MDESLGCGQSFSLFCLVFVSGAQVCRGGPNSQEQAEHWETRGKGEGKEKEEEREIIHLVLYLLHGHFTFFLPISVYFFPPPFCGSGKKKWRTAPPTLWLPYTSSPSSLWVGPNRSTRVRECSRYIISISAFDTGDHLATTRAYGLLNCTGWLVPFTCPRPHLQPLL